MSQKKKQFKNPKTLVLSSQVYESFVDLTGLKIQIPFLINKKKVLVRTNICKENCQYGQ